MEPMNHASYDMIDPVARLRVLAAALPGSVIAERSVAASFDRVWEVITDLELAPRYETNVVAVEIVGRSDEQARIVATLRGGDSEEMDVRIADGWCLMQSLSFVIAFGARPAGPHTLLAHLEHSRTVATLAPPERLHRAHDTLVRELDAIEALATNLP
jgi:hypothetical protein